nr:Uncharacterised protein [Klebsiella pneumoniae]
MKGSRKRRRWLLGYSRSHSTRSRTTAPSASCHGLALHVRRRLAPPAGWPASPGAGHPQHKHLVQQRQDLRRAQRGLRRDLPAATGKVDNFLPLRGLQRLLERSCSEVSVGALCALSVCRACSQYESGRKCVAGISSRT